MKLRIRTERKVITNDKGNPVIQRRYYIQKKHIGLFYRVYWCDIEEYVYLGMGWGFRPLVFPNKKLAEMYISLSKKIEKEAKKDEGDN
jgi:hypothetical protein